MTWVRGPRSTLGLPFEEGETPTEQGSICLIRTTPLATPITGSSLRARDERKWHTLDVRFAPNSDREKRIPANGHVQFTPEGGCAVQLGMSALGGQGHRHSDIASVPGPSLDPEHSRIHRTSAKPLQEPMAMTTFGLSNVQGPITRLGAS
jgi:hypothetical protein